MPKKEYLPDPSGPQGEQIAPAELDTAAPEAYLSTILFDPPVPQPPQPGFNPVYPSEKPARRESASCMFSLRLPQAWKSRLADEAWKRRTTTTGLINTIIREWLEQQEQEEQP